MLYACLCGRVRVIAIALVPKQGARMEGGMTECREDVTEAKTREAAEGGWVSKRVRS